MIEKSKYYIRISPEDRSEFESYLKRHNISFDLSIVDVGSNPPSILYIITMDSLQELSMKLSFTLIGCMNFVRIWNKLVDKSEISV